MIYYESGREHATYNITNIPSAFVIYVRGRRTFAKLITPVTVNFC